MANIRMTSRVPAHIATSRYHLLQFAAAALITTSCKASDSTVPVPGNAIVTFAIQKGAYAPGSYVRLKVENSGTTSLALGGCANALQRFNGVQWATVPSFDTTCDAYLSILPAGGSVITTLILPDDIATGVYRARYTKIRIDSEDDQRLIGDRFSDAFRVDRGLLSAEH